MTLPAFANKLKYTENGHTQAWHCLSKVTFRTPTVTVRSVTDKLLLIHTHTHIQICIYYRALFKTGINSCFVVFVSVPSVPFIGFEFEFTFLSLPLYKHTHLDLCKGKSKYTMEYEQSGCMAPLILILGTGWR